jgi:hypothetical protein
MITAHLQGGMGNQMFQISTAVALARRNNDIAVFDPSSRYLPLQSRQCYKCDPYEENVFRNINFSKIESISNLYREPKFSYSEILYIKNMMLHGYFQSEKYFVDFKEDIIDLFAPSEKNNKYIDEKYGKILQENSITSVHIRRGDYLKFSNTHPACTREYYASCFESLPADTSYFIFSDDPVWCANNFKSDKFHIISGEEDYIDLYLMSKCENNIIANSSFSWWAAWLNKNNNKRIFSPKKWFGAAGPSDDTDIIPKEWEKK